MRDNENMITYGNVDGRTYRMIKMSKEKDDSGYNVEFMDHDIKGENLHAISKVFLPSKQAKTLVKFFQDKINKKDIG